MLCFFSSRRRHTISKRDWSSDVCSSDLLDSSTNSSGLTQRSITQYLRPSARHLPVDRWVKPEEFVELSNEAERIGFLGVMAGPRSEERRVGRDGRRRRPPCWPGRQA